MSDIDDLLNELAKVVKPVVEYIEAQPMVTKGHYGQYMLAIDKLAKRIHPTELSPSLFIAIGVALQRAGASKDGVQGALRVMGYL